MYGFTVLVPFQSPALSRSGNRAGTDARISVGPCGLGHVDCNSKRWLATCVHSPLNARGTLQAPPGARDLPCLPLFSAQRSTLSRGAPASVQGFLFVTVHAKNPTWSRR